MNKKQLVTKISSTLGQSKADAERTFDSITTIILDALKNDDTVKIAGFGTYKVAKRKARVGRNPRTGEQIQIAASQKVKFLPAKSLTITVVAPASEAISMPAAKSHSFSPVSKKASTLPLATEHRSIAALPILRISAMWGIILKSISA